MRAAGFSLRDCGRGSFYESHHIFPCGIVVTVESMRAAGFSLRNCGRGSCYESNRICPSGIVVTVRSPSFSIHGAPSYPERSGWIFSEKIYSGIAVGRMMWCSIPLKSDALTDGNNVSVERDSIGNEWFVCVCL
ncbi:unnamed protein product, partial [Ectocarpus sp. 8 AP-2014]